MKNRTDPVPPSAADARPIRIIKPRTAVDPDALGADLAAREAMVHATTDDRVVALGLDLAPVSGYAYALVTPGKPFDPKTDFTALGQLDLRGGDWDSGAAVFVRLRSFFEVIRPSSVFYRELPVPTAATGLGSAVAVTANRKADGVIRGALRETLTGWAARCSVPCESFGVGSLKRRFTGRGVASKADLVAACNDRYGVNLDTEGVEITGIDRVAVAALGLLAGLEGRVTTLDRMPGA